MISKPTRNIKGQLIVVEAQPRAMDGSPWSDGALTWRYVGSHWCYGGHPVEVEAHLGTKGARPVGKGPHPGAIEARFADVEALLEHWRLTLKTWRLTPEPWRLTLKLWRLTLSACLRACLHVCVHICTLRCNDFWHFFKIQFVHAFL